MLIFLLWAAVASAQDFEYVSFKVAVSNQLTNGQISPNDAFNLCNQGVDETWYPMLEYDGVFFSIFNDLPVNVIGVPNDVHGLWAVDLSSTYRFGPSGDKFNFQSPTNEIYFQNGTIYQGQTWIGGPFDCQNWTDSSGMQDGTSTIIAQPVFSRKRATTSCDTMLPIVCVTNITDGSNTPPEPYFQTVYATENTYPGSFIAPFGPAGADAVCESEFEPGWKALLYREDGGLDDFRASRIVSFSDNNDMRQIFRMMPTNVLPSFIRFRNPDNAAGSFLMPYTKFGNEMPLSEVPSFWLGSPFSDCDGWNTSDSGTSGRAGLINSNHLFFGSLSTFCDTNLRLLCLSPKLPNTIFEEQKAFLALSNVTSNGDAGGKNGADLICGSDPTLGNYSAIVADGDYSPIVAVREALFQYYEIYSTDGRKLSDLTYFAWNAYVNYIVSPPLSDTDGAAVSDPALMWLGTRNSMFKKRTITPGANFNRQCLGWTDSTALELGVGLFSNSTAPYSISCDEEAHFICFLANTTQTEMIPLTTTTTPTPTPTPTTTSTVAPTVTPSPSPTATPTVTPSPSPTSTPTVTPSPSPTSTPTTTPTPTPTEGPMQYDGTYTIILGSAGVILVIIIVGFVIFLV